MNTEELETRMEDEESERASLVSRQSRMSRQSSSGRKPGGFFSRLVGRTRGRAAYQPIHDGEE